MRRKLLLIALTLAAALCFGSHGEAAWATELIIEYQSDFDDLPRNATVTEVVISDRITEIPAGIFAGWSNLQTVTIKSDDLTTIGDSAFDGCTKLASVTFPEDGAQLESIGDSAFYSCVALNSINFPENMTSLKHIGNYAFNGCGELESLSWTNALEHIGYQAFAGCNSLERIGDCSGLKKIGAGAFSGTALTSFTWPAEAKEIDAADNLSTEVGVSSEAFSGCTALATVILPESITYIGDNAFSGCENLATVSTSTESSQTGIHFPESITSYGKNALAGVPITEFTLPDEMTTVPNGLFLRCTSLESVTLHEGITSIGANAFESCTALAGVTLPSTVTTIAQGAFKGSGLTSISIPQNVTSLGELDDTTSGYGVFEGCASLRDVTLPAALKVIGMNAFKDCSSLTVITVADDSSGENKLPASLVSNEPDATSGVGKDAFFGCEKLTSLSYPQHLDLTKAGIPEGAEWTSYEWGDEHEWEGEGTWEWSADDSEATLMLVCKKDKMKDHTKHSAEITAKNGAPCSITSSTALTATVVLDGTSYTTTKSVDQALPHKWDTVWTYDETAHWHACMYAGCALTDHLSMGGYAKHSLENGVCTECGYAQPYQITLTASNHGTLSASRTIATVGTVITLSVTPNANYQFSNWTTVPEDLVITEDSGTYVFTMPAQDVTISANFTQNDPDPEPDEPSTPVTPSEPDKDVPEIDVTEPEHGTVEISPAEPAPGDIVTITPTPDDGWEVEAVVVTDEDGDVLNVTDGGDGSWSYEQPAGDVTIDVTFAECEISAPVEEIFADVSENDWFRDAVQFVYDSGLMTGTGDAEFSPDLATTRGMIVSILYRLEGGPAAASAGFADVHDGDWYADAVNWAASEGIVAGFEDGTFRANAAITREQLAAILMNYSVYRSADTSARAELSRYSDAAEISSWATTSLEWAVGEGLLRGVTTSELQPQGEATRAQVAAILARYLGA